MKRPATILIDGKRYLWRDVLEMRRRQLEESRKAQQPALFDLKDDHRPAEQRVPRAVDHAIGPAPDLLHQRILPKPPGRQRALSRRGLQPLHQ